MPQQEKKRLAMAVRERQLGALGMRSNERGQVTAQCSLTQQVADLAEENGAVCCICREGYKYQPTKVTTLFCYLFVIILQTVLLLLVFVLERKKVPSRFSNLFYIKM